MSNFEQAAKLNNEGVIALFHGNGTEAVQLFSKSAWLMRVIVRQPPASSPCPSRFSYPETDSNIRAIEISVDRVRGTSSPNVRQEEDSIENPAVNDIPFHKAIIFPANDETQVPGEVLELYAMVVVFNMALCYHFLAIVGNNECMNTTGYLKKAQKMYELVLKGLMDGRLFVPAITDCSEHYGTLILLKLACINNLSTISSETSNLYIRRSRKMTQERQLRRQDDYLLQNTLNSVLRLWQLSSNSQREMVFQDPEIHGLLMHALIYLKERLPANQVAAAA